MDHGDRAATRELSGEVAAVIYTNAASGFGVVELTTDQNGEGDDRPRAAGPLAALTRGQSVRLAGEWVDHARHGPTFQASIVDVANPTSHAGLRAFLASGRFPGVGDALAQRLVDAFGEELPAVAADRPERLATVRGVSEDLAVTIGRAWRDAGVLSDLVRRLAAAGVALSLAAAAHRSLGEQAGEALATDPYALLEVPGAGWQDAEALGHAAGVPAEDERRLSAAARAAHRRLCGRHGHVAVAPEQVAAEAGDLLDDRAAGQRGLSAAGSRGDLVEDAGRWYTPADLAAERGLADEIARLQAAQSRVASPTADLTLSSDLTTDQARAVRAALSSAVSVLTGGPGTGKTRTITAVVAACEQADLRVALCAPTGRAAKHLEEVAERPATTIHRLLEATGAPDDGFRFRYDGHRRLPHDLVVADEWSMADCHLAWALLRAVGDGAHVLLVGDADQLPSVGPGAVLRDLLDPQAGGLVSATRLTHVHRQAAASRIVTLAHEVNAGAVGELAGAMGDVFAVPERSVAVADRVAEIVAVRAPDYFGCTDEDVQVLAPMYRGPAGVDALNTRLKERLNPAAGRRAVAGLHEGDRVVQTRNDAALDVANGDVGTVIATDPGEESLEVAFPHGIVVYDGEAAGALRAAWCLTVHKAQGGEWPVVVLVCDRAHRTMLWRELVYTAVTRASAGLLLVGEPSLVAAAATRTGSGTRHRATRLAARLAEVAGA